MSASSRSPIRRNWHGSYDFVNLLGLVTIFLCMIQTVIYSRIASSDKDFSRQFNKLSFGLIASIYFGLKIALPLVARIR